MSICTSSYIDESWEHVIFFTPTAIESLIKDRLFLYFCDFYIL